MAVTFVSASEGTDAGVGVSVPPPAGAQAGDLLIAVVASNSEAGYTHVPPAGWTILDTGPLGSAIASTMVKVASSDDLSGNIVFQHTPTGTLKDVAIVAAYRGEFLTPQVDVHAMSALTASQTNIPVPVVTTTEADATLVVCGVREVSTTSPATHVWTIPAGTTLRGQDSTTGGGAISACMVDLPQTTPGNSAVGDFSTDLASSTGGAFVVAIYEGDPPPLIAPVFRRWTVQGWYPPREA